MITAETILITHALLSMWTILSGAKSPRDFAFYEAQDAMFDKLAIEAAGLKGGVAPVAHPRRWQGNHHRRLHHRLR